MGKTYEEDRLFDIAFPLLKRIHRIPNDCKIRRHENIHGHEVDVFITWRSRGIPPLRSMVVELKQNDISKLIEQVVARRDLALWVYGVIGLPTYYVMDWILRKCPNVLPQLHQLGIGIITMDGDTPVALLRSRMTANVLSKYLKSEL